MTTVDLRIAATPVVTSDLRKGELRARSSPPGRVAMLRELSILGAAVFAAVPAAATIVTVQMSGTWAQIGGHPEVLDGSVSVGDPFSLTLTYDDALPDDEPSDCCFMSLDAAVSQTGLTGNYTFRSVGASLLSIDNDQVGEDSVFTHAIQGYTMSGPFVSGYYASDDGTGQVRLTDSSQTALDSDSLVDVNWNLADYDSARVFIDLDIQPVGWSVFFDGPITSIRVIPEPSTALLCALGLAGLAAGRRLRS